MIVLAQKPEALDRTHEIAADDRALMPLADVKNAKLAVIVCHFNWSNFRRPVFNLLRFLRQMDRQNIPVFGVEAILPNQPSLMEGNSRWKIVPVTRNGILWQKEALLNEAAKLVPSHIPFICASDPDIAFDNVHWASDTIELLKNCKIGQPYKAAVWTAEDGRPNLVRHSCAHSGLDRKWSGHPGFAWAMHRSFFEEVGMYPYAITGAGDTVTATAILNIDFVFPVTRKAVGEINLEKGGVYDEWRHRCRAWMGDSEFGWVEGNVWHEWHGHRKDRLYSERHALIRNYDVLRDLRIKEDGWIQWTEKADPKMIIGIRNYFLQRKEDG